MNDYKPAETGEGRQGGTPRGDTKMDAVVLCVCVIVCVQKKSNMKTNFQPDLKG